jgi:hypothetical protein
MTEAAADEEETIEGKTRTGPYGLPSVRKDETPPPRMLAVSACACLYPITSEHFSHRAPKNPMNRVHCVQVTKADYFE